MKRRLVIAAHADDETIGCGGTLASYAARGAEITVGVLTRDADDDAHAVRVEEAREAWSALGVRNEEWALLRAHPLTVSAEAVDAVGLWLSRHRPDVVMIPHEHEQDRDHAAVGEILRHAKVLVDARCVVLSYEVWTPLTNPVLFEDVTAVIDIKQSGIEAYRSQCAERDYAAAARGLARYRGVISGRGEYVEAFGLVDA